MLLMLVVAPFFTWGEGGHDAFSTVVLKMLTLKEKAKLF